MKEIEKAARENSIKAGYNPNSAADAVGQTVYESGFKAGVEWLKSMFPMMYFPPCTMPEDRMAITKAKGEKFIVATTYDYIIFYKHRGYDIAYREYWKGHHNNKWKWKVKYGRYVNDDEILCWMRKEF